MNLYERDGRLTDPLEVEKSFSFENSAIICKECGRRFRFPSAPRPGGNGFWGYGFRGTMKGLTEGLMARHFLAHERATARRSHAAR